MKKIKRAVCGTVAVIGIFATMAGFVLCMCETPDIADQLRNMLVGLALMFLGSALAYIGGSRRWMEGPYVSL